MFWGLIMEPQRRYTQQVKKAFHISMASLDISTSSEEPAQVMCSFEGRNYLLCTLRKPDVLQCPLDLNFEVGSELSFAANGKCHVHLTGYLIDEPLTEGLDGVEEEEDEAEEQESEDETVEVNERKRSKKQKNGAPPAKKAKVVDAKKANSDSDESDVDIKDLLENTLDDDSEDDTSFKSDEEASGEEEEDDEDGEEEEEEGEDEEDDDEEEESSLSEAESEEEEKVESPKKKNKQVNGITKPEQAKSKKEKNQQEQKEKAKKEVTAQAPKKKVLNGGVIIEEIKEGEGAPAKPGKFVTVYYEGRLKQNNKVFDAAKKGAGFSFRLGAGEVIKGWDVGVVGMKPGSKRRIICPPPMAYGQKGSPPAIPANSTLIFEVELKKIR